MKVIHHKRNCVEGPRKGSVQNFTIFSQKLQVILLKISRLAKSWKSSEMEMKPKHNENKVETK